MLVLNKDRKPAGCPQRFCSAWELRGAAGARAGRGAWCEASELLCQRCLGPDGSCVCPQHFPLPTAAVCSLLATTSGAKGVQNHLELPSTAQASAQGKKGKRVKEERLSDLPKPALGTCLLLSAQMGIFILNSPSTYLSFCLFYLQALSVVTHQNKLAVIPKESPLAIQLHYGCNIFLPSPK